MTDATPDRVSTAHSAGHARLLEVADEIRHFFSVFDANELPPSAPNLRSWLDPNGYWYQPERRSVVVYGTAEAVHASLDHIRQAMLDSLPVLMTAEQFRVSGHTTAEGVKTVARYVELSGTCLLPVHIVEE